MQSYLQKLWKRSCEEIQIRIKTAYFCNFYDFSQTYPQQNDVIRRYTEKVISLILFLSTETDHRVTRKCKLLSFSDL